MRWLLLKDLQILRRSPLLVGTVVVYPVVLALIVGIAFNAGPGKPKVAFLNEVPTSKNDVSLGSQRIDASKYAKQIFRSIDAVPVKTRAEARAKVASGQTLAALIIPADITDKLSATAGLNGGNPKVEVLYNADNALKVQTVRQTINAELARANVVLSRKLVSVAANYISIIAKGGNIDLLGQHINVLGLRNAQGIVEATLANLPKNDPLRGPLQNVATFARVAAQNLDVSKPILASIGQPIGVKETVVKGKSSSLDSLVAPLTVTVALTFVTLLLAAGMLALEREENAFGRLVRGLVSRLGLVIEKVGLAALCAFVVCLLMLAVLAIFVDLDWSRAPLWIPAVLVAALGFAGLGVAVGCLAREVRSSSLIVFALSLPMAALALVPSGATSDALYKVVQVVNFVLPFKWALQALDAAINDAEPSLLVPSLHLLALTAAFVGVARLAIRRF